MENLEKILIDFLKHIKEVHTDQYGQLEICDTGDDLDPTIEKVVKDYIKSNQPDISQQRELLLAYEKYCEDMSKIYSNPRPKVLLIDAFLSQ